MGLWSSLRAMGRPARRFHSSTDVITRFFAELTSSTGPVSRDTALSVPAVQRGRNMICSISTLPLREYDGAGKIVASPLLAQIDPHVPNVVMLAQTLEDLLFEGISWWRVLAYGWDGYPIEARHLDVGTVSVDPPKGRSPAPLPSGIDPRDGVVWVDGLPVGGRDIIRFDSPNPGLLRHAARAIRRAVLIDQAATMYANDPRPLDYFTPDDQAEEMDEDEIKTFLSQWATYRKQRSTGYVKRGVNYNSVDTPSPRELQLADLDRNATLQLANGIGVDPEDLGVSTTSRTYSNAIDRRVDRINDVLAPFMRAITDRLSMGDVTKRGHVVAFDLDGYMKSNPTERWSTYKTAHDLDAITVEEIRMREGWGPMPATAEPDAPVTDDQAAAPDPAEVDAARPPAYTFDDKPVTFVSDVSTMAFSVNRETRVIEGLALPWGKYAGKYGLKLRFERGSVTWSEVSRVKMLEDHGAARGVASYIADSAAGLKVRMKVARGSDGDRLLELAEDGVYDGLSVGVDFDMTADTVPDPKDKTALLVRRATLREVSLTAMPAFDDARVTKVAASLTGGNLTVEPCSQCGQLHAAGVACPQTPPAATPPVAPEPAQLAAPAPTLALTGDQLAAAMAQLLAHNAAATPAAPEPRQIVNPTVRPVATTVLTEPPSYRFGADGSLQPAAHDFGVDMVRALNPTFNDAAAYKRAMEWVTKHFDVQTGDVNELNPTINMPGRYVDEREFTYPIFAAVNRGAPPNGVQPFSWPKFNSASGLVAAHTEAVEPTTGNFTTTSQSVTPVPLSGKATVTRETWDMGGTPGLSDILWRRITRDWYETIEAAIVTMLDAATPTSLGTLTAGGGTGHATLVQELRRYLALLQFARGGFRFDVAFAEAGIYSHLVDSYDTTGRPFFPQQSPSNADGESAARWAQVTVGGVPFLPAWALGATVGAVSDSSYLIDRTAVDAWATPPQRLTFDQTEVRYVHVGIWGYHAEAINDTSGVREIAYDPVA